MVRRSLDVDALLGSIDIFRRGTAPQSPSDVFVDAGVNAVSDDDLVTAVKSVLKDRPEWIETWQSWSYDKRWSPSPYLDGLEVGHYDHGQQHVRHHTTTTDACADFVLAEVRWVVDRRVVEPS